MSFGNVTFRVSDVIDPAKYGLGDGEIDEFEDAEDVNNPDANWFCTRRWEHYYLDELFEDGQSHDIDIRVGDVDVPAEYLLFLRSLRISRGDPEFEVFVNNYVVANSEQSIYNSMFGDPTKQSEYQKRNHHRVSCYYHFTKSVLHGRSDIDWFYRNAVTAYKMNGVVSPEDKQFDLFTDFRPLSDRLEFPPGSSKAFCFYFGLREALMHHKRGLGYFTQLEARYGIVKVDISDDDVISVGPGVEAPWMGYSDEEFDEDEDSDRFEHHWNEAFGWLHQPFDLNAILAQRPEQEGEGEDVVADTGVVTDMDTDNEKL